MMDHIHLNRSNDMVIVCPATAHFINKAAKGLGDDLLTTLFLSHDFHKPYVMVPAMNSSMYRHPVTQDSLRALAKMKVDILPTDRGTLACGEVGEGKLLEPEKILHYLEKYIPLTSKNNSSKLQNDGSESLSGKVFPVGVGSAVGVGSVGRSADLPEKAPENSPENSREDKILITGGGTREPLDGVRFISNTSTGRTACALVETFRHLGFSPYFVHSKDSCQPEGKDIPRFSFTDFQSLSDCLKPFYPATPLRLFFIWRR